MMQPCDFNQMATWTRLLEQHMPLEGGLVVKQAGYKKFSVGHLLEKLKELDDRVPYTGSLKGAPSTKPWRAHAYNAVAAHFGVDLHEDKHHGLGKCIPGWNGTWDGAGVPVSVPPHPPPHRSHA